MKILFAIIGLALVVALVIADYKWRQWMARHRRDRDQ